MPRHCTMRDRHEQYLVTYVQSEDGAVQALQSAGQGHHQAQEYGGYREAHARRVGGEVV